MKRDNVNYVVAGAFVLSAGIGLLVLLYAIMGRAGPTESYHTYLANVSGLKRGTAVHYEGYRIGRIESIEPEHTARATRYRVDLSVQATWPIREGSIARVSASGLISAVAIDISAGEGEGRIAPGSEIPGEGQVNLFAALSDAANDFRALSRETLRPLAESLSAELSGLMADLRGLASQSLRPLVDAIGRHIEDPELFPEVKRTVGRLARVADRIDVFLSEPMLGSAGTSLENVALLSGELRETNRDLAALLGAENRARVASVLAQADDLAGALRGTNDALQAVLDEENRAQLRLALASIGRVASSLEKVAGAVEDVVSEKNKRSIEAILVNVETVTSDVGALVRDLDATRARLDGVLAGVDRLVDDNDENLTAAAVDLRRAIGVIASHVGAFGHHLEGTTRNLHEFTRQIRENPALLVRASPQPDRGRSGQ